MKKGVLLKCVLGVFMFFICLGIKQEVTSADCILFPYDDFYSKNYNGCQYSGRSYTVNSDSEEVTSYVSPVSDTTKETLPSGRELFIYMVYYDNLRNEKWGQYDGNAWIPMSKLTVVYDDISFAEEHQSEFTSYNGELDKYLLSYPVTLYQYPNSKIAQTIKPVFWGAVPELNNILLPNEVYTDSNGNKWGYVSTYYCGYIKGWYCISTFGKEVKTQESDIPVISATPVDKGDVDGDGLINLYDTSWVLKAALNICCFSEEQKNISDMNSDSSITLDDAQKVLRLALNIE